MNRGSFSIGFSRFEGDKYRFGVVVRELRDATSLEYKTALVAFINCIIISTPQLKDRLRIRNEFVGLKLLAILNDLKSEAASDTDLSVQIDVFEEQKESDESQLQGKLKLLWFIVKSFRSCLVFGR